MSAIKQIFIDTIESQQVDIEVDSDVQLMYIPYSGEVFTPSRSELLGD